MAPVVLFGNLRRDRKLMARYPMLHEVCISLTKPGTSDSWRKALFLSTVSKGSNEWKEGIAERAS